MAHPHVPPGFPFDVPGAVALVAKAMNLPTPEQRGALAERERIRLELLAEALACGDEAIRLAGIDNAYRYHRTSELALREFARRLEAKP